MQKLKQNPIYCVNIDNFIFFNRSIHHFLHETYQKLEQEYSEALSIMDFEKIDALFPALRSLGVLPMQFAHNPDENPFPIYPTIPSDMANLIKIQKIILKYLL